jgi:hypothetical protein
MTWPASALVAGMALSMLLLLGTARLTAHDVTLAENGRAQADIVIPSEPSAYVRFAAEELKQYLDKITGGDFKITSKGTSYPPSVPIRIHLGQSPEASAAGLNPETLKRDGFFISVKAKGRTCLSPD